MLIGRAGSLVLDAAANNISLDGIAEYLVFIPPVKYEKESEKELESVKKKKTRTYTPDFSDGVTTFTV